MPLFIFETSSCYIFDLFYIFEQLVETIAKYALNMASTLEISHITLSQNMKGRWYGFIFTLFFQR
jgi:hypothetical protein